MIHDRQRLALEAKAFLLDWLVWAYMPAAVLYFSRDSISDAGLGGWLYGAAALAGLVLAAILGKVGVTIGERLVGLAPLPPVEERGQTRQTPWYRTQLGWTAALLAIITFVLGWQITEINLYYVFTRADKLTNMTDRLLRPYWPVIGALLEKMIETIFLALMATIMSVPIAAIVSFFCGSQHHVQDLGQVGHSASGLCTRRSGRLGGQLAV